VGVFDGIRDSFIHELKFSSGEDENPDFLVHFSRKPPVVAKKAVVKKEPALKLSRAAPVTRRAASKKLAAAAKLKVYSDDDAVVDDAFSQQHYEKTF
jgi:hypothetical protein